MTEDESAEKRAAQEKFIRWLQEAEAAAAELVEVGDLLFWGRGAERSCALAAVSALQAREGGSGATARAGAGGGAADGED
jgi:hypothetical protein